MTFYIILFSALTAFVCRLLPFLIKNNALLNNQNGSFYRFLNYSTQAMLGVIIYDTAFHKAGILKLIQNFSIIDGIKILLLLIMFIWVAKTKKILLSFLTGLCVYFIIIVVT
jgi:branched-subunit amino acid transport protein